MDTYRIVFPYYFLLGTVCGVNTATSYQSLYCLPILQDSCLPVGVFVWNIENHNNEPRDVSITFTFKNGTGGAEDKNGKRQTLKPYPCHLHKA